jgi:hypothetical protein
MLNIYSINLVLTKTMQHSFFFYSEHCTSNQQSLKTNENTGEQSLQGRKSGIMFKTLKPLPYCIQSLKKHLY